MNNVTEYHATRTRAYYQNLHMSYRFGNTTRGMNGPIFSREFCGGSNANGPAFRQDMATRPATLTPLTIERGQPFGRPFTQQRSPTPMLASSSSLQGTSSAPRLQFQLRSAFPGGPPRISSSAARYL